MARLSSKPHIYKYEKMAGKSTEVDWIPTNKVKCFMALFDNIKSKLGNNKATEKYIGFSQSTADRLKEGKISVAMARKILDAYNRMKKQHV